MTIHDLAAAPAPDQRRPGRPAAGAPARLEAYGFDRPTLADVQAALTRVFGEGARSRWADVTREAGLSGGEGGLEPVRRVAEVLRRSPDGVLALCGQSAMIRVSTFERLAAARDIVAAA